MTSCVESLEIILSEFQSELNESEFNRYIGLTLFDLGKKDIIKLTGNLSVKDVITQLTKVTELTKMNDIFLVEAVVNNISKYLEEDIKDHGERVNFNLKLVEDTKKEYGDAPGNFVKLFEEVNRPGYRSEVERKLSLWNQLLLKYFNYSIKQSWFSEKINK